MTESNRYHPQYEYEKPVEGYTATIDWVFGSDPFTKELGRKLKFSVPNTDLENSLSILKRDPEGLKKITEVWGRTALFQSEQPGILFDHVLNAIELSGFGTQQFETVSAYQMNIDFESPIKLPSSDNFADKYPNVTKTAVLNEGKEIVLGDDFSFSGAYTQKQIVHKFASNLFVLNKLSNEFNPPFLVPIPIAIGHYPTVMSDKGEYAYFGIFKVPYGGKRTGNVHVRSDDGKELEQYAHDLIRAIPGIAPALAYISNSLGLTHNQPHPSNVYIPREGEGLLPFLADFSTMYPLRPKKQGEARARELGRGIDTVWNRLQTILLNPNEGNIVSNILLNTIREYYGLYTRSPVPGDINLVEPFLSQVFQLFFTSGELPSKLPSDESWGKIQWLEKKIQAEIKKSFRK